MKILIVILTYLILGLIILNRAESAEMIQKCRVTSISVSGGSISWSGQSCWWELAGGSNGGSSSNNPFVQDGGGSNGSVIYSHNEFDTNGDNQIDCWKNIVPDGDHHLDDGDDFGLRVINGHEDMHYGIDIQAPYGSIIRSPAYGKVIGVEKSDVGANGAYVRLRYINEQNLFEAVMIHMVDNSPAVSVGDVVYPGTPLGLVNNTGSSTGNHLHFQLYLIDVPISPDGIDPWTGKPYNYTTLGPKAPINPIPKMGHSSCELSD